MSSAMILARCLFPRRPSLKFILLALCTCCLLWTFHVLSQHLNELPLVVNPSWLAPTGKLLPPENCHWPGARAPLPPTFPQYHQYEIDLSKHNAEKYPQAKYLFISNHFWGLGLGNVMQDYVLHSILAHAVGRTPVFDNYTWTYDMEHEHTEQGSDLIPSRLPLTALFSGALAGSPLPSGRPAAISSKFYNQACQGKRRPYDLDVLKWKIDPNYTTDGRTLFESWAADLRTMDEKCIEVNGTQHLFDHFLFGSDRLHSLLDTYLNSEILQYFSFSPLIHDAFNRNMALFLPPRYLISNPPSTVVSQIRDSFDPITGCPTAQGTPHVFTPPDVSAAWNETRSIPGLLVLHIRHGDFEQHCTHLANWGADFQGFNTLLTKKHSLDSGQHHPDHFSRPSGAATGKNTPENHEIYRRSCLPAISEIVQKVHEINEYNERHGKDKLSTIYVMTNAQTEWLVQLKDSFIEDMRDETLQIHTSRDLHLTHEQKYVAQALDMYLGARAEVFVGNGFSSLTSNIVMLRMGRGLDPLDTRFW